MLGFNLIKLVNSPLYRRAQAVESLRCNHPSRLERVRGWCYLLVLANIAGKHATDPHCDGTRPLLRTTRRSSRAVCGTLFHAGILSALDAFLDREMNELLCGMGLSDAIAALLERRGDMGRCSRLRWPETAAWGRCRGKRSRASVRTRSIEQAYLDSLQWVSETLAALEQS
jgi:c-di-GMP-related signal transduction protein